MSERTALFLASLSHGYFLPVLLAPFVCGAVAHQIAKLKRRARPHSYALGQNAFSLMLTGAYVLLAASIAVFVVALLHVGCAGVVEHSQQCLSNVRQICMGMSLYEEDYDEHLPPARNWSEAIESRVTRDGKYVVYVHGNPFHCPAAESPASYGMNAVLGGMSLAKIDDVANTVVIFDADAPVRSYAGGARDLANMRHNGSPNIGFVDGHAKSANRYGQGTLNWLSTGN